MLAIAWIEYVVYHVVVYGVCAGGDMAQQAAPSAYGVKVGYLHAVFPQRIQYQFFAVGHLFSYMTEFRKLLRAVAYTHAHNFLFFVKRGYFC